MKINRLAYLIASYAPYRIPVYDEMHRRIGDGFTVITSDSQDLHPNERLALEMSHFPKKVIKGRYIDLAPLQEKGLATPMGMVLEPTMPFVLASLKPEVVISINFSLWTLASLLLGYPTVIFWEGTFHTERTVKPWRKKTREWMIKRAKAFVSNGILSKQYLVEALGAPADRVWMGGMCPLHPPVEIAEKAMQQRKESIEKGDRIRFIFSGQLIGRKGPSYLVQAASILKKKLGNKANFEIFLLGEGPEHQQLENMIKELDVEDIIIFGGYAIPTKVWPYYADAHVFILPTLQDNWPLVVPEAMLMGLPVLLSKYAGSYADLIREGENGYIFDPENPQQIADLMGIYVENPSLIPSHGDRSRQLALPYTPEHAADAFISAAEAALALS